MIGRLCSSITKCTNPSRSPSPRPKLLSLLEEQNVDEFVQLLENSLTSESLDIDYNYEYTGNFLHIVCQQKFYHHVFIDILLQHGADINAPNTKWFYKTAIHFAVENKNSNALRVLLGNPHCNVNSLTLYGDTALHYAVYQDDVDLISLLFEHPALDVNMANRRNQTHLHSALSLAHMKSISKLLEHPDIDLDARRDFQGRNCREIIISRYPQFALKISQIIPPLVLNDTLFSLLYKRLIHEFQTRVKAIRPDSRDHDGKYTYLQYACNQGMVEVVETLLQSGVDPNQYSPNNADTPMMIAAYRANYTILTMLHRNNTISFEPVDHKTVLHSLFYGMYDMKNQLMKSNPERDHLQCLEYLLRAEFRSKLDLNYPDSAGNTALNYAAQLNNEPAIKALLHAGAYVGRKNPRGKMPLNYIRASILEECLDKCISTNGKHSRDQDYEIIFDYSIFTRPKMKKSADVAAINDLTEIETLLAMNDIAELRKFLKHPVFLSYLNLKWNTVAKYFYINLIFYATFCILLTTYICYINDNVDGNNRTHMVNKSSSQTSIEFTSNQNDPSFIIYLRYLTLVLCGVLFLRELYQFYVSPIRYLKYPENWLEISLIGLSVTLLVYPTAYQQRRQLSSVAIMVSWMELMLLIGRHPLSSTNIEMFKTVSYNFLKFLAWYSILILAFALSFHILFKDDTQESNKFFKDPALSIIKSIIMLTGEFDAGSIPLFPFDPRSGANYALFVLFVFLVAIVLFNLLNGLAVSDTQAIRSDAELLGIVSRVKLIAYVDAVAAVVSFKCLHFVHTLARYCTFVPYRQARRKYNTRIRIFYENANLFPYLFLDSNVSVLPNDGNIVFLKNFGQIPKRANFDKSPTLIRYFCRIDSRIVKEAAKILEKNSLQEGVDNECIAQKFNECNSRIQNVEKLLLDYNSKLESVDKSIKQIMDVLKSKS